MKEVGAQRIFCRTELDADRFQNWRGNTAAHQGMLSSPQILPSNKLRKRRLRAGVTWFMCLICLTLPMFCSLFTVCPKKSMQSTHIFNLIFPQFLMQCNEATRLCQPGSHCNLKHTHTQRNNGEGERKDFITPQRHGVVI